MKKLNLILLILFITAVVLLFLQLTFLPWQGQIGLGGDVITIDLEHAPIWAPPQTYDNFMVRAAIKWPEVGRNCLIGLGVLIVVGLSGFFLFRKRGRKKVVKK
jgi:hypothetical protein